MLSKIDWNQFEQQFSSVICWNDLNRTNSRLYGRSLHRHINAARPSTWTIYSVHLISWKACNRWFPHFTPERKVYASVYFEGYRKKRVPLRFPARLPIRIWSQIDRIEYALSPNPKYFFVFSELPTINRFANPEWINKSMYLHIMLQHTCSLGKATLRPITHAG